jgi:hypothetical protein
MASDKSLQHNHFNAFLTGAGFSLGHLKIYLRMRFDSYGSAGRSAGLSACRVRQIVTGKYLPKQPEIIKRIAEGWDIDSVVLAQLFEKYRDSEVGV